MCPLGLFRNRTEWDCLSVSLRGVHIVLYVLVTYEVHTVELYVCGKSSKPGKKRHARLEFLWGKCDGWEGAGKHPSQWYFIP